MQGDHERWDSDAMVRWSDEAVKLTVGAHNQMGVKVEAAEIVPIFANQYGLAQRSSFDEIGNLCFDFLG